MWFYYFIDIPVFGMVDNNTQNLYTHINVYMTQFVIQLLTIHSIWIPDVTGAFTMTRLLTRSVWPVKLRGIRCWAPNLPRNGDGTIEQLDFNPKLFPHWWASAGLSSHKCVEIMELKPIEGWVSATWSARIPPRITPYYLQLVLMGK